MGDTVNFSGSATDPEDGPLPASGLSWTLIMHHCPSNCHTHTIQTFSGASGSFVAPDHEYPSHLELRLTATDSGGRAASTSVMLQPRTVDLTFTTSPSGLQLSVGSGQSTTPFQRTVIVGSANSLSAPSPQALGSTSYEYASWSDAGSQTHNIVAPATATTYTATYTAAASTITFLSNLTPLSQTNGWGPIELDRSNGEEGAADGRTLTLNGVTYAKGIGVHAASDVRWTIPTGCTTFVVDIGIDDEVTGTNGGVVFQVFRNTTSLYTSPQLNASSATIPLSLNLGTAGGTLRLLAAIGNNGANFDHADWAGARLVCGTTQDTTPPTVSVTSPAANATGVAPDANVTATFSEPMNAATIETARMTLVRQGTGTPVAAAVTYDAANRRATLNPSANLQAGAVYTATVDGGAGGVTDVGGNLLAADHTWELHRRRGVITVGPADDVSDRPRSALSGRGRSRQGWRPRPRRGGVGRQHRRRIRRERQRWLRSRRQLSDRCCAEGARGR